MALDAHGADLRAGADRGGPARGRAHGRAGRRDRRGSRRRRHALHGRGGLRRMRRPRRCSTARAPALARALDAGRIALAADALGACEAMIEQSVAYAQQRKQFGRAIGSFQAVKHMCAEMIAALEPARSLLWYAAHSFDALPDEAPQMACHVLAHVSEIGARDREHGHPGARRDRLDRRAEPPLLVQADRGRAPPARRAGAAARARRRAAGTLGGVTEFSTPGFAALIGWRASMRLRLLPTVALSTCVLWGAAPRTADPGSDWLAQAQRTSPSASTGRARTARASRRRTAPTTCAPTSSQTGIRVHDRTAAGSPELLRAVARGRRARRRARARSRRRARSSRDGARVEIRRPGLVEWYVNSRGGPRAGLHARGAAGGRRARSCSSSRSTGAQRGAARRRGRASRPAPGASSRYGELVARDARGARARRRASRCAAPQRVRIVVDDAGAAYPLVIDPLLTETADAQLESNQAERAARRQRGGRRRRERRRLRRRDRRAPPTTTRARPTRARPSCSSAAPSGIAGGEPRDAAARSSSRTRRARCSAAAWRRPGDVNGDGYADVIVGAPLYDAGQTRRGRGLRVPRQRRGHRGRQPRDRRRAARVEPGGRAASAAAWRAPAT